MRIAFVSARPPFPLDSGGRIRTFHLLRQITRVHAVTLVTATDGPRSEAALASLRESIPAITVRVARVPSQTTRLARVVRAARSPIDRLPYTWAAYRDPRFRATLAAALRAEAHDLLHCDHIQVAHALAGLERPPAVLNAHNVESVLARRVAETERAPWKRRLIAWQCGRIIRAEIAAHRLVQRSIVVSDVDGAELERMAPGLSISLVPNGVDVEWFAAGRGSADPHTMAFVGAMDWLPNVDAAQFFVRDVFPRIRARIPNAQVWIVGRHPSPALARACAVDGVHLTGTVDDVRPHVARARLIVVPLRIGGGTRLKILEAWAMGKAVLSTSVGAEGLPATDGANIELADTPEDLAARAVAVLGDAARAARLGVEGRRVVAAHFSWPRVAERLLDAYEATVATARSRGGTPYVWNRRTSLISR